MLLGAMQVRQNATITTSYVAGDGKGGENLVRCDGANTLVLYAYVSDGSLTYNFKVDFFGNADEGHQDTAATAAATEAPVKREYRFVGPSSPEKRIAIVVPVHGRTARISAKVTSGAPTCALWAATFTTVGGEGQVKGPFLVRRNGAVTAQVTGDGPGGQNSVPIADSDRVILFVDGNLGASATVKLYQETSLDDRDYYRPMYQSGTNPIDVALQSYDIDVNQFGGAGVDGRVALALDTLGAWARFTFSNTNNVNNCAVHALTGRG